MKEVAMLRCQDCEQIREDVTETICPYNADVNNTVIKILVCDNCYQQRADDI
jgi:hypothetical protein